MNKKEYYKDYYMKNKIDILNRVKNNYYKKVNKSMEDKKEKIFIPINKYVTHIIVQLLMNSNLAVNSPVNVTFKSTESSDH